MIRIAVCDDNADFLLSEIAMIEKWSEQSGIPAEIYRFDNGDSLIAKNASVGMETARELRRLDNAVKIIFLTSSPEFALESYDVKAQGYLLKPVTYEKIKATLDDCSLSFVSEPKNTVLKTAFGYQKIYFHDIEYAEAQNKRVIFHLRGGKEICAADTLHSIEERFTEEDGFFKCHRSYLVYMPNVDRFGTAEIRMKSGSSIPIARGYGKAFKEAYFSMMFRD